MEGWLWFVCIMCACHMIKMHEHKHQQESGSGPSNRTSKRTLQSRIAPSQVPGAGNGLWLLEAASIGQVVGRYSGDPITEEEAGRRVQVRACMY